MKRFLYFSLCLLILTSSLLAQSEKDKIVVIGSASIEIPADKVTIKVFLRYEDKIDGKSAFTQHKEQEIKLLKYLRGLTIPDSLITFSLLQITTRNDYSHGPLTYQTTQNISFVLTELAKLPSIQLSLISNGFTSFQGNFESSKTEGAIKEAWSQAIQQAKIKAEIMAESAGKKIRKISKISDTDETEPRIASYSRRYGATSAMDIKIEDDFINIPQALYVDKQVRVVFDLVDDCANCTCQVKKTVKKVSK